MKDRLAENISAVLAALAADSYFPNAAPPNVELTIPKLEAHGDYATNVALIAAKGAGKNPHDVAREIVKRLGDAGGLIERTQIAGPGFINFFLKKAGLFDVIRRVAAERYHFGRVDDGADRRVLVEFVSANPTGPLHIGHGRGAVTGDALSRVLAAAGFHVSREYYINDAGVQIETLGRSTWLRYRQLIDKKNEPLADGLYQGAYIREHARALRAERGGGLTEADIPMIAQFAAGRILKEIEDDLAAIGVTFDHFYSERSLHERGLVRQKLEALKASGLAFEQDGALWFRSTHYGDEKDRVLVKSTGETTYLAADVAYHGDKIDRGFDQLIDIWGADHHGYIARMKAAIGALGRDPHMLTCLLIQMVNLLRGGERVSMSTRAGEFVTLRELTGEVGADATRFFFLMRRHDSQLDFDVDLAKDRSNKNPVFYVQYMHARICSVFAKAAEAGIDVPDADAILAAGAGGDNIGDAMPIVETILAKPKGDAGINLSRLGESEEVQIAQHLAELPNVVRRAALDREPHRLTVYVMELAGMFHPYYFQHRIISDDAELTRTRLAFLWAIRQATRNVLAILGISAPETM
ncbi:arginine--tRNA ligase [bacterium]|nr:arginine--tRNA ligase [bacterium]